MFNYALAANEKARRLIISCAFVRDIFRASNAGYGTVAGEDRPFAIDAANNNEVAVWKGNSVMPNIAKAI